MNRKKGKNTSIKAKLLGTTIPVVVLIVVVLITVAYEMSASIIKQSSRQLLESSIEGQASRIESWLSENLAAFQMAKTTIEKTHPDDATLQTMLDSYYNYNENYPEGLYIADATGRFWKASQSEMQTSNAAETTWYKEGLTRINMSVTSAYKNDRGQDVISASGILNDGGSIIRVMSADMTLDHITILVNSFIGMDHAEAFLVDTQDGTILANRDSSMISTKIGSEGQNSFYQTVAKKIDVGDYSSVTINGNMTEFKEITGTNWLLVSYIPTKIVLADLSSLRLLLILISAIAIVVLIVLMERTTHVVIKPIKKITKDITKMASGDFTVKIETKGNDEIAAMSRSVEKFVMAMRDMFVSMGAVSERLGNQAVTCDDVSQEMNHAANIQSESMGEMTLTVNQLSDSVNEIASNATELANVVADTKADSDTVNEKMRETVTVSEQGRKDMERVGDALESIRGSISNLEEAVNKVGTASGEIVQIIQLIGNIADETNLLSLNASIEAARAGEAGRGFAVVAGQIGKLANDSTESVAHITDLISEINRLVEDAVRQAGNSADDINDSAQLINTAVDTFNIIFQNIQDTSELINSVVEKIDKVDQVAMNVAAISEEQAASSDEILATSEAMLEQAKSMTENSGQVASASKDLTDSSVKLAEQVGQFHV